MHQPDLLIVGAGPVGSIIAERAASVCCWKSLLIDRRTHIAGNCYDRNHESGLLVHEYGPHYFRTNNDFLIEHLKQFTEWIPGEYIVKSQARGQLFPFPINLTTLEQFFNRPFSSEEALQHLDSIRSQISHPANSEEYVLSRIGRELYEAFYLGYTLKQWGIHPRDLDSSVCGRIPVRLNRDSRYVDHKFQLMPKHGYTRMFARMLSSPLIKVLLGTDFKEVRTTIVPKVATVYTGPIDEYFDNSLGRLPWRSLDFEFTHHDQEFVQPCVQINYPNDFAYTRSVEIKHVTKQQHAGTVITHEYPRPDGDPYYPILNGVSRALLAKYQRLAAHETAKNRVLFVGRLAQFRYMNMDEAFETGLAAFEQIKALRPTTH